MITASADEGGVSSTPTSITVLGPPPPPPPPPPNQPPPQVTGSVKVSHSSKGLTSITVGFNEPLDFGSATNMAFYRLFSGVKKHHKTVYTKPVKFSLVTYNIHAESVTINLKKPFKGAVDVVVEAGIVAADGKSSEKPFSTVVR